jgi:hypothetical protein
VTGGDGSGTAYFGVNQPRHGSPRGFAYGIPSGVEWIDATGVIHDGSGHPSCLPPEHGERIEKMEAVKYPLDGGGYSGEVLWIQC